MDLGVHGTYSIIHELSTFRKFEIPRITESRFEWYFSKVAPNCSPSIQPVAKNKSGLKKSNVVESSGPIWRWVHHLQKLETDLPSKAYLEILVWGPWLLRPIKLIWFFHRSLHQIVLSYKNQKSIWRMIRARAFFFRSWWFSDAVSVFAKIPLQNIIPLKRYTQK